jgi:formylglycine-generating enzyme required for sulfatase activity
MKPIIEFVEIPGGTFIMGSTRDEVDRNGNETHHEVALSPFKISKYTVTIEQFKAFVDDTGYITSADNGKDANGGSDIWTGDEFKFKNGVNWKCDENGNVRSSSEYNYPVIHINWNDAKAFADWMDCRLPTEAEWEYACRAGTKTAFNTGINLTTIQSNYNGEYPYSNNVKGQNRKKIVEVGSLSPNEWGLYEMHGNIWEWCNDWYDEYQIASKVNPTGPSYGTYRVLRGGVWIGPALFCRSAYRFAYSPDHHDCAIGFRLADNQ